MTALIPNKVCWRFHNEKSVHSVLFIQSWFFPLREKVGKYFIYEGAILPQPHTLPPTPLPKRTYHLLHTFPGTGYKVPSANSRTLNLTGIRS